MGADLITRLIKANTPPELVAEVAMALGKAEADRSAIAERRAADRDRQAKRRNVTSRDITDVAGHSVTSRDNNVPSRDAPAHEGTHAYPELTKTTDQVVETLPSEGQKTRQLKRKSRTQIAPDAQPNDADRRKSTNAGMTGPTFRFQWAKFRDRHIAEGSAMADWSAAWRTWVDNWVGYGSKQVSANGHYARAGPAPPDQIRDPVIAAIQRRFAIRATDEPATPNADPH